MSFASTGIYSREEFAAQQAAGNFNPHLTYERYVEIRHLRAERSRMQMREVYGTETPNFIEEPPELVPQDDAALDSDWVTTAEAERKLLAA